MAQESQKQDENKTDSLQQEVPVLCTNSCGFFGSSTTMNLCSVCYKALELKQAKVTKGTSVITVAKRIYNTWSSSTTTESSQVGEVSLTGSKEPGKVDSSLSTAAQPSQIGEASLTGSKETRKVDGRLPIGTESPQVGEASLAGFKECGKVINRCFSCQKRVGLTAIKCRCGNIYCSLHRYSDEHDCPYDYKSVASNAISQANPVVKAEKLENKI